MKEDLLRGMIRKQIKSSLREADFSAGARGQVGKGVAKIEKMASVKMLKKALGIGSPDQQAAGLLKVVQAISGNSTIVAKKLARMLMKGGIGAPAETPGDVGKPAGAADRFESVQEATPASLSSKSDRLDKTQAMKMLKNALGTKPATQQADFVIDLIKGLDIKPGAKQRLFQKMRKDLK